MLNGAVLHHSVLLRLAPSARLGPQPVKRSGGNSGHSAWHKGKRNFSCPGIGIDSGLSYTEGRHCFPSPVCILFRNQVLRDAWENSVSVLNVHLLRSTRSNYFPPKNIRKHRGKTGVAASHRHTWGDSPSPTLAVHALACTVSPWVEGTVATGYRWQFMGPALQFRRVRSTCW